MAKQLNVNMAFTANTSQAKREVQNLQNTLNNLMGHKFDINIDADKIHNAITATAELSAHLQKATNIDTGNLDFSKLSQSLKSSGKTLMDYGKSLQQLGPEGQKAFMQLTAAVAQAEVPIRRTHALVKEFATTLANTARWQISSSVLHGFMGALQSAYGYAQDLNESLNNIRIVTGQSVDDMAKFAKEANKAAKALSATTTEYTNASLIYYQQGLSDAEVKKRADVTIKLANVSRQSSETVSEQMTAVWNNFYDGSKSLEYYADVMTALGAATASSTEEIAGGLEKFAAVADTIGLSYEYAASALATITSNTRQSEEVVGTALKTIFARIQGLNLGETLDDGTTLNKYSQAMAKVGINILDASGNLKDMDNILNEMGNKWDNISKAQQVALAQTVAGTRQYNQLIALMDNWNSGDGDSFMANLATATDSSGALQEQADIYAESWEAAADRVQAAAEAIYDKLINDEFFIDLLNNVEKIISFVDKLIDNLGGLEGVLIAIGAIVTKVFSAQLSQSLTDMAYNIKMMTKAGQEAVKMEKQKFIDQAVNSIPKQKEYTTKTEKAQQNSMRSELELQQTMLEHAERMTAEEEIRNKMLLDRTRILQEQAIKAAATKDETGLKVDEQKYNLQTRIFSMWQNDTEIARSLTQELNDEINKIRTSSQAIVTVEDALEQFNNNTNRSTKTVKQLKEAIKNINTSGDAEVEALITNFNQLSLNVDNTETEVEELITKLKVLNRNSATNIKENIVGYDSSDIKDVEKEINTLVDALNKDEAALKHVTEAEKEAEKSKKETKKTIEESTGAQKTWSDVLVTSTNVVMTSASAITMLSNVFTTLSDPDVSGWEKFTNVLTTMTMLIPTLISLYSSLKTLINQETAEKLANLGATLGLAIAEKKLNFEKAKQTVGTKNAIKNTVKDTVNKTKETISTKWNESALKNNPNIERTDKGAYRAKKGTPEAKATGGRILNPSNKDGAVIGKMALKSLGQTAGAFGLIAASIALVAGAVAWGKAQYEKYSKAAQEAAEVAKNAADNYEKAASTYESFKANMSDYKTAKDGLKELVKGTTEYTEAVLQANEAARKMIEQYDNLEYNIDADGLIQINEDSFNQARQEQLSNIQKAQINKQIAQQNANEAKTKSEQVDFLREDIKSTSGGWANFGNVMAATGTGAAAGAGIGAGLGLLSGPFAAALSPLLAATGAIVGGIAGLTTGIIGVAKSGSSTGREKEAMEKLAAAQSVNGDKSDLSKDDYKVYLKETVGITDPALINSLAENRKEAEKLAKEININSEATKALNKQIAASALSNNQAVQDSEYTDEIVATAGKMVQADKDEARAALDDAGWGTKGISKATKVNDEVRDVFADYAAAAGLTNVEVIDTTGTDKNRKFVFKDAEGKEHTVDLETMKDVVAADKASQKADERGTKLAKIYNNFDKQEMAAVNAAVNQNYDKLNVNQIMSGNFGANAQSLGLNADDLKAMGYDSAAAFNSAMAEAQKNAAADWDKTLRTHTSGVDQAMNAIASSTNTGLQNISYSTLKAYGDMLEGFGDSAEATNFSNALTGIMEANSEDAEAIMQAATGIDWSQGEIALEQLNGQLYDMGVEIDENSETWKKFQEAVNNMSFSVVHQNLETIRQTLVTISKLAKDVGFGDVISDEDYKQLTDIDGSLKKDFVMTADGYMYVGEGNLKNKAKDATMSQLTKTKSNNAKATAAYNALQEGVFKGEDWTGLIDGTDGDAASAAMAANLMGNANIMSALGVDAEYMQELIDAMNGTDATAKDAAREKLQAIYGDIQALEGNYKAGLYDDKRAEEVAASQMSTVQLDEAVTSGVISSETAETFKRVLSEATNADKDIFRDINKELEDVEFNLSKIEKAKENAFGPDKIDLIKQETEQLQQQIEAEKERQDLLNTKINNQKTQLTEDYSFLTFNADGSISNYDDLYTNLTEDEWEAAKKAIDDYEQSLAEARESELTIFDLQSEANSKNLEAYEAADEALSKYTEKLQHHNNVLEHYKNLSALIGKENDYKSMGEILKGQASILSNSYKASEKNYQMYQDEVTRWEELMGSTNDADLLATYTKNWEDAQAKSREAQDAMLSDLQTWAESEKAILDNTLADLGHSLETTLTGGQTFDELSTQMERAQSLQEEYLTTTNQIYETTKMMRTAQQAIDTSSNVVAKEKLKNFITETKSLQEQGKLSRYELDMQQAKYDLLVAEIALEEAQNAKSTVRLQRDAEGNFGYVYTADSNAVNDAQQQYDDAENALYNKGLEGANDYSQKSQQTMQEMVEALKTIQTNYQNGMYSSEQEYETAMLEVKEHYLQKLQDYSMLYNTAIGADSRVMAEAWSSSFVDMTLDAENWDSAVEDYISGAKNAFNDWSDVVATIKETTGSDLTDLANKVSNVTTASNELATALFGTEGGDGGIFGRLKEGLAEVVTAIQNALNGGTTPDTSGAAAASGGLTSNWGPAGKMLMVHESELILNKEQTNKFFDNLAIMESILSTIDSYALGQQFGGMLQSPAYGSASSGTLEQSVHIEASFPSVTDRNEIEEAFNNLVNKASQYANRK